MHSLPVNLYSAQQVRELDRRAIEDRGIPGAVLMKRAGRALLSNLLQRWPQTQTITVYCGAGNNGGDGYVVAALAAQTGISATVVQVAAAEKLTGDARRAWEFARQEGVPMTPFDQHRPPVQGVVVDALLGTGLKGSVRADFAAAIEAINGLNLPVVAVDIPSGLNSDTGAPMGSVVRAELTVTFIGLKCGLLTAAGPAVCGDLRFDALEVPEEIYGNMEPRAQILDLDRMLAQLPPRPRDAHKGQFGHVMVIGGDNGMGGAAGMAAEAALRLGSGLVSVATRSRHVPAILARRPEIMVHGVESGQDLEPLFARPSVLVLGPGLGHSPWSEQMLRQAAAAGLPMVVDADALNILSEGRVAAKADTSKWVITPHPGEAARLLGSTAGEIQGDRFASLEKLRERFRGAVVLKGAGSLVAGSDGGVGVCAAGNPGMATGGMGDILSGVIGGLLAQGLPLSEAARLGVCLHATAADRAAAREGERGLAATDLIPHLRHLVNGL